jgi:hypothetical protein
MGSIFTSYFDVNRRVQGFEPFPDGKYDGNIMDI